MNLYNRVFYLNLKGAFVVEVEAKIFNVRFQGKIPQKPREVIPALNLAAEQQWGNWRGYAFVYVLNDLPKTVYTDKK